VTGYRFNFRASPKESQIEKTAVEHAVAAGWDNLKIGFDGWPDRLFWRQGVFVFIEYKRPGEAPRINQERKIKRLLDQGCWVGVCDTVAESDAVLAEVWEARGL